MKEDKDQIRRTVQGVKDDIGRILSAPVDDDAMEEMLRAQAGALDSAFRMFFIKAPEEFAPLEHYAAALKMQNQFRHTALAVNALKNKEGGHEKK